MTTLDLLSDPDFLTFCQHWQDEGRAPFWAADWFEERGLDAYAVAWRWAAEEERPRDRVRAGKGWFMPDTTKSKDVVDNKNDRWFWSGAKTGLPYWVNYTPFKNAKLSLHNTFPEAILAFLVSWAEVFGTGTPTKQEAVA